MSWRPKGAQERFQVATARGWPSQAESAHARILAFLDATRIAKDVPATPIPY